MKKIVFFILVFCITNIFAGRYNIDVSTIEDNGWAKPFNRTLVTSDWYDYNSQIYFDNHDFWHGGVDIISTLDEKVYSIAEGKVVKFYRKTSSTKNMSVIYIQYKTSDNTNFLVIYGHVSAKSNLIEGATVKKGEHIGDIKRYGSPDHIHFGITTNLNYHGESFGSSASWTGVVNPLEFLRTHRNQQTIKGIFDGAGSLVSPKDDCWGCDKDEADMHPHSGVGSTVVFQWLYDEEKCHHIDIYAESDIGPVIVKYKSWSKHYTEKAYKYDEHGGFPATGFSVEKTSDDSLWTTVAITTVNEIYGKTPILAYCRGSDTPIKYANRVEVEKNLVDVTHEHYWTGNGSLITIAKERTGFGVTKDWAVTFKTKKSLTAFQWYSTSSCRKVKITNGETELYTNAKVSIKGWSDDFDKWENKCTSLPCILSSQNT